MNAPRDVPHGCEMIRPARQTPLGNQQVRVINTRYLMAGKLSAYAQRGAGSDYNDIIWLFMNKSAEIKSISNRLSHADRDNFYRRYAHNNPGEDAWIAWVRDILSL